MEIASVILGLVFAALGIGGLLSLSLMPSLQRAWPYRTRLYLGKLADSRKNRIIASIWLIGSGLYIASVGRLGETWSDFALAGLVVLALVYIFVREPAGAGS